MIKKIDYNYLMCWKTINCPDDIKKNCWAYRLNLGLECWLIRRKLRNECSWQSSRKCCNCNFFKMINQKFYIE